MLQVGEKVPRAGNAFTRWFGRFMLRRLGVSIEGQLPNEPRFMILGVPHTSNWDFVIVLCVMLGYNLQVNWVGKQSMFKWPFGGLLRKLGGVAVDRGAGGFVEATVKALKQQDKLIFVIAPEGTRTATRHWKTGFHRIARGAGIPIVPGYLDYERKVLVFHPAITASDDVQADMRRIRSLYRNARPKHPERWIAPED